MTGAPRVLVARLDSEGDVLLSGPAVRAVAATAAHVTYLCGPLGRAAAGLLPGVDEIRVWACPWVLADPPPFDASDVAALDAIVAEARPDVAVVLTSFHQSPLPLALLLRLAGVRRIVGASVDHAGVLLDVRLRPGEDFPEEQPEAERALRIAAAAGFSLPTGDDGRLRVHSVSESSGLVGPYVVVHPGATAPARTAPAALLGETVRRLVHRGLRVVVTGSPSERRLTAAVAGRDAVDLGGRTSFAELAAVLAGADCVVVGNTGPSHLAAAVGTPVVSLFAPVVPVRQWAPYGVPHRILGDQDAACRGTRATTCPVPSHPCLSRVSAAEIADAVDSLLAVPA